MSCSVAGHEDILQLLRQPWVVGQRGRDAGGITLLETVKYIHLYLLTRWRTEGERRGSIEKLMYTVLLKAQCVMRAAGPIHRSTALISAFSKMEAMIVDRESRLQTRFPPWCCKDNYCVSERSLTEVLNRESIKSSFYMFPPPDSFGAWRERLMENKLSLARLSHLLLHVPILWPDPASDISTRANTKNSQTRWNFFCATFQVRSYNFEFQNLVDPD